MDKLAILLLLILPLTSCSSALIKASENGDINQAAALLDQGANIEEGSNMGLTPLTAAVYNQKFDMVKFLVDKGADVNGNFTINKWAPLHFAAYNGNTAIAEFLLNHKADVNALTVVSATPLHWAISEDHADVVKMLLDNGARVDITGSVMIGLSISEYTPVQLAQKKGNAQIIQMLEKSNSKSTPSYVKAIPKSDQIGSISSVNGAKREILISTKRTLKIGELVYVDVDGNMVIMSATYPMMTSSKCQLEGKDVKYFNKLSRGMPVYKY